MGKIEIKIAERNKVKIRLSVSSPSGGGKSYSALLIAKGLVGSWEKVGVIDTENKSSMLYSHLGKYNVVMLEPDYTPENYIDAIQALEEAGMDVIIIDSATHEWDGAGGCLEQVDRLGGKFQDWAKVTPRHRKFLDRMLQSRCHIITTTRRKQDYAMTQKPGESAKVEKLGLKEVQRDGFEYEMTLAFGVDMNHLATASKDRTGMFMDKPEFVITEETGKQIAEWCDEGISVEPTEEQTVEFEAGLVKLGKTRVDWESATKFMWSGLSSEKAEAVLVNIRKRIETAEDLAAVSDKVGKDEDDKDREDGGDTTDVVDDTIKEAADDQIAGGDKEIINDKVEDPPKPDEKDNSGGGSGIQKPQETVKNEAGVKKTPIEDDSVQINSDSAQGAKTEANKKEESEGDGEGADDGAPPLDELKPKSKAGKAMMKGITGEFKPKPESKKSFAHLLDDEVCVKFNDICKREEAKEPVTDQETKFVADCREDKFATKKSYPELFVDNSNQGTIL